MLAVTRSVTGLYLVLNFLQEVGVDDGVDDGNCASMRCCHSIFDVVRTKLGN